MSSLIDRQAAIKVASKECYELRGVFEQIEDGLNALPAAEAIPIEWICKKWLKRKKQRGVDTDVFIDLISDWREENEID